MIFYDRGDVLHTVRLKATDDVRTILAHQIRSHIRVLQVVLDRKARRVDVGRKYCSGLNRITPVEEAELDLHRVRLGAAGVLPCAPAGARVDEEASKNFEHCVLLARAAIAAHRIQSCESEHR